MGNGIMPASSVKRGLGSLTVFDEEQRNEIHERSLELHETMGMMVCSNEALLDFKTYSCDH